MCARATPSGGARSVYSVYFVSQPNLKSKRKRGRKKQHCCCLSHPTITCHAVLRGDEGLVKAMTVGQPQRHGHGHGRHRPRLGSHATEHVLAQQPHVAAVHLHQRRLLLAARATALVLAAALAQALLGRLRRRLNITLAAVGERRRQQVTRHAFCVRPKEGRRSRRRRLRPRPRRVHRRAHRRGRRGCHGLRAHHLLHVQHQLRRRTLSRHMKWRHAAGVAHQRRPEAQRIEPIA
mmetsp:Transcript_2919/g.8882  ORF Transcript_2919/g.8882 Transcript_2919/m.8882 type:complete len:235 (-) Transcript_2919:1507-2211(-)